MKNAKACLSGMNQKLSLRKMGWVGESCPGARVLTAALITPLSAVPFVRSSLTVQIQMRSIHFYNYWFVSDSV